MKKIREIAQWVIDNRYPKGEYNKIDDFEMYHTLIDMMNEVLCQQSVVHQSEQVLCDNLNNNENPAPNKAAISSNADYRGFCTHLKEYEENGIPTSFKDLVRLAKQYNCEIAKVIDGKLVFETM